ncbi:MAG TPA: aromatic ring-hydroxylating dioxygenase subunit alpha [Candidatus Binataceae bacterium]|nr:aromatic ring-hydroxylating dioxygenase subunit alpha [Candidatus Binataceae bacterium]
MMDQVSNQAPVTDNQPVPGWYAIAASSGVVRRKPIGVKRFGAALVLWRSDDGRVVCLPDRCSHRSAALSPGKIRDGCLECPYHGLRFDAAGRCVLIPANGVGAPVPDGFNLPALKVREEHGIIWYWYSDGEPAREVPWIPGASEPGFGASEYWYDVAAPYLRIVENLLDFHHFPILHKSMIPGIGTRMDEMDAHVEDKVVVFSATMRYEKPGLLRRDAKIKARFTLPSIALIEFGGFYVNYFLTPIDDTCCWLFARYRATKMGSLLGSAAGKLAARYDRAIFMLQDRHVLLSQSDPPGDFSRFNLYPADRALALLWGLRKQAILEAQRRQMAPRNDSVAAAAG